MTLECRNICETLNELSAINILPRKTNRPCASVGNHRKREMLETEMQMERNENFYTRSVSFPPHGMTLNFLQGIFQRGQSCIEEKR